MDLIIYTIGVYGSSSESFFDQLTSNKIDTFIDIRRRRAVRGSKFSYVNSNRLQNKLKDLNIKYIHILDLAPTNSIRDLQKEADKKTGTTKRERDVLGEVFIDKYKSQILDQYNLDNLANKLKELEAKKAVLFCVEQAAQACHRSLVADKLKMTYSCPVINL